jgi:hypothetical protein
LATKYILILEISDFIINALPITLLELLAAIFGSIYLNRKKITQKPERLLVLFLWVTFLVELIGAYAPLAYFSGYKYLGFVEGTVYSDNFWLYNILILITYVFYTWYFRWYLKNKRWRLILGLLILIFLITTVINLFTSDVYYTGFSQFSMFSGAIMLFLSVGLFYFELLRSDIMLYLTKFLPFYISVGALILHLCITPIDFFSKYFSAANNVFVNLRVTILLYANIFMYVTFILGFIVCSRRIKSY